MRADFKVMLDACVMANFGVADLLFRLAEKPRLYLPLWTEEILQETARTQLEELKWPDHLVKSFRSEVQRVFPESLVKGYEHLIEQCANDIKDRHVLAGAIHAQAEIILTFNLKDFDSASLKPWSIVAQHPQEYLLTLFSMEPIQFVHQLEEIAKKRDCSLEDHLIAMGRFLPALSTQVLEELG